MPGIVTLVTLISLDVVRGLVASNNGLPALSIVGASNTTPIVLETAEPHGIVFGTDDKPSKAHVIVSGVLGNTAANNIDTRPRSFTIGQNLAVVATVVDETHLSLSAPNQTTGILEPLAGNGAYAGGGQIQGALYDQNAALGRIYLGRENEVQLGAPPRIVFVPRNGVYGPRDVARGTAGNEAERRRQLQQRAIASVGQVFEVQCWGQATPPDPEEDFDATAILENQVILSTHLISAGNYQLVTGEWLDQNPNVATRNKAGHFWVFGLQIGIPIVDVARTFVDPTIAPLPTSQLELPGGGGTGTGCSG